MIGTRLKYQLYLYGGTVLPGKLDGKDLDAVSAFEGVGQYNNGEIDKAVTQSRV